MSEIKDIKEIIETKETQDPQVAQVGVAIDMSRRLLLHTNNSYLLEFCRKLIVSQQSEILYMNNLLMNIDFLYKSELLQN